MEASSLWTGVMLLTALSATTGYPQPPHPPMPHDPPSMPQNPMSMPKGRPPMAQGRPPMSQGRPPMPQGRPPMPQGRPPMPQVRPPMPQGRPPMPQGRLPMPQDPPLMSQGRPPMPQHLPPMSQDPPLMYQRMMEAMGMPGMIEKMVKEALGPHDGAASSGEDLATRIEDAVRSKAKSFMDIYMGMMKNMLPGMGGYPVYPVGEDVHYDYAGGHHDDGHDMLGELEHGILDGMDHEHEHDYADDYDYNADYDYGPEDSQMDVEQHEPDVDHDGDDAGHDAEDSGSGMDMNAYMEDLWQI